MNKNKTLMLCYLSVLSALGIVANIFTVPLMGSNVLSFAYIPAFLAGIYFGPIAGGAVGMISDIVGHLIHPINAFNPLILVGSILLGVIPGLVWLSTKRTKLRTLSKLIISLLLTTIIVTSGINTFAYWWWYSGATKTFWLYLLGRLPFQAIMIAVNGIILATILGSKAIDKLLMPTIDRTTSHCHEE